MKTVTLQLTEREYNHLKKYAETFEQENSQKKAANPIVILRDQIASTVVPKYHYDTREFRLLLTTPSKSVHHMVHTKSLDEIRFRIRVRLEPYLTIDEIETLLQNIDRHLDMERQELFKTEFQSQQIREPICVELHVDYLTTHTVDEAFFLTETSAKEYLDRHRDRFLNPTVATVPAGMDNYGDFATLQDTLLSIGYQLSDPSAEETPNTVYLVGEEQHFLLVPSDTENYEERYTITCFNAKTNETVISSDLKKVTDIKTWIEKELKMVVKNQSDLKTLVDEYYEDLINQLYDNDRPTINFSKRGYGFTQITIRVSYVLDAVIPRAVFATEADANSWIEKHKDKYQTLRIIPKGIGGEER